jgi:glycosyltransferase involved in cell wall biosynthesis
LPDIRVSGNGIVYAAVDVATHQRDAGHDVAVASGPGPLIDVLREHLVQWFELPLRTNPKNIVSAAPRLRNIVRRFDPDVVHVHTVAGALIARLVRPAGHFRLVATAHRAYDYAVRLLRVADVVIALSCANAELLEKYGIPPAKLVVVRNGTLGSHRVESDEAASEAAAVAHPAIVTVAGLFRRKGIDVLIEAFAHIAAEHPDGRLYIVGEGPHRREFEKLAAATPWAARIVFEGFQRDAYRFLRACDVFVLASRRDSFPLVLLEAREAGCAIVATDVDGSREALDFGRAGMLVPAEDAVALAGALSALLDDPGLAATYRREAVAGIEQYSAARMASETLAAYGLPVTFRAPTDGAPVR